MFFYKFSLKWQFFLLFFSLCLCPRLFASSLFSLCGFDSSSLTYSVNMNACMGDGERKFLLDRNIRVQEALYSFVGGVETATKNPVVSICLSGGGYRAMCGSCGLLEGARNIGLLDATTYVASISGSTWCITNFLMRLKRQGSTIEDFRKMLRERAAISFSDPTTFNVDQILTKGLELFAERRKIEALDLWGGLLADRLFGDFADAQDISFDEIRKYLIDDKPNFPFPLFAVVLSDVFPYEWAEVNPFEVCSNYLGSSIPTVAFDSLFKAGFCDDVYRERSLGWFCALFGSAYNLSIGDILIKLTEMAYENWSKERWLVQLLSDCVDTFNLHEARLLASPINNFMWKTGGALSDRKTIELSDAGMAFNIPIPLVLEREVRSDIIIVYDASSDATIAEYSELRYAAAYAKRKGFKFPSLDSPRVVSKDVVVFEDELDKEVPIVIYFANPYSVSSLAMSIKNDAFDALCDSAKELMTANKETIVMAVRKKMIS